ncbi:MAG: tetratricopeptide repeat protein [Gammaproteobacteria bacterium]|jgi:predicted Zn-dependent protease
MNCKKIIIICYCAIIFGCSGLVFAQRTKVNVDKSVKIPPKKITLTVNGKKISLITYDDHIYKLAYDTYLANGKVDIAYMIAQAAVQQNPKSLWWRRKLAITAGWYDKPRVALAQWVYLAERSEDRQAIDRAINIAGMLHENELLAKLFKLRIKYGYEFQKAWTGFIAAKEALGKPEEAILELQQSIREKPELYKYEKLGALYHSVGDVKSEFKVLTEINKRFGIMPKFALRQAEILYSYGKIKEAHNILVRAASKAKDSDYEFWRNLGQIAWMVDDTDNAKLAFAKLHKQGKLDAYSLLNYILLLEKSNPREALNFALNGYHKFKKDNFVLQALIIALNLQDWDVLQQIIFDFPSSTKKYLSDYPIFYVAKAQLLAKLGRRDEALTLYQKLVARSPERTDLKIGYLWFLIDFKYKKQLRLELDQNQQLAMEDVNFASAYAAGYVLLGEPQNALIIYKRHFAAKSQDPDWLINFADTLNQLNNSVDAIKMRELAWYFMLKQIIANADKPISKTEMINFARIAMYQGSGDIAARTISQLSNYATDTNASNHVMIWALQMNNHALAEYFLNHYAKEDEVPVWIQNSIALNNNDREYLSKLLNKHLNKLPYRDRVTSASRVGNERLAQTLAYRGLYEHPTDSEMYKLFEDTKLPAADNIRIAPEWQKSGNIYGAKLALKGTKFITPRISVMPWVNLWRTKTKSSDFILPATSLDKQAGLRINRRYRRGITSLALGYRNALAGFLNAKFINSYAFTSKLDTVLSLGYNQEASESTALLIGGMKDEAKFDASYKIDVRDTLFGNVSYSYFKSQDDVHLGNGQRYELVFSHKFQLAYPDWNARLFVASNDYQRNGRVSNKAAKLIPSGQAPSVDFFFPVDSNEYGGGFGFGQAYRDNYTHAWRPFVDINAYYNTDVSMAYFGNAGIAGSVFGRDHLVFFVNYGLNIETFGQKDYVVGMSYNMYF